MNDIFNRLEDYGIIPVVKIERAADAIPLGRALCQAGLPLAEITFRTAAAEEAIKTLHKNIPELLIGAGTVLTIEQVEKAINAGARFIVSPGYNPRIVNYCLEKKITIIPGVNSPSQIEMGLECGLEVFKFFPAEESGGLAYLKAIQAPYGNIRFIPTGGINQQNFVSYLANNRVLACGGSWLVNTDLISKGEFQEITRLTAEAIHIMLGFEFAHFGINEENEAQAQASSNIFSQYFNFKVENGTSSFFTGHKGKEIEIMKGSGRGKQGHIAIATNDIKRALFFLEKQGIKELKESRKEKNGKVVATYLELEISGFAVHLLQK